MFFPPVRRSRSERRPYEQSLSLEKLKRMPGPALKSDRKGQFSIRINDQYRLCFRWTDEGPTDVEIVDYH